MILVVLIYMFKMRNTMSLRIRKHIKLRYREMCLNITFTTFVVYIVHM